MLLRLPSVGTIVGPHHEWLIGVFVKLPLNGFLMSREIQRWRDGSRELTGRLLGALS